MNATIDNDTGTVIPEETKQGIVELNKVAAGLDALKAKYSADTVPDVETDDGYADAKRLAREVGKIRIATDKARKTAKDFYLSGGRRVDAMAKEITAVIEPLEEQYKAPVKALDDKRKAEAEEKARIEQERIDTIESRITRIKDSPAQCLDVESAKGVIDRLESVDTDTFDEFAAAAQTHINTALEASRERLSALEKQAAEAADIQRQREEQEAKEAEQKRKADELAQREREMEQREAAQRAKEEAERKAEAQRKAAAERAAQEKQEAVERAQREERERLEAEQRAKEEAEAAERERIAEEKAEAERLAALAPDAEKLRAWFESIPDMPEMSTREGRNRCDQVNTLLMQMEASINSLEKGKAA